MQEALLAAARQWPVEGVPDDPGAGWSRSPRGGSPTSSARAGARRRREELDGVQRPADADVAAAADERSEPDDELTLLFLCCHPALTAPSQIALTLRAVGGLTTAEIAAAFLVPEATMAQRISRAKQRIVEAGGRFEEPSPRRARPSGWPSCATCSTWCSTRATRPPPGAQLQRRELAAEAIRLTRRLQRPGARRRRGRRAARPDAAHRRPPCGAGRARRRAGPAGRAGPVVVGPERSIAEGVGAADGRAPARSGGAVPAPGRDRRGPRRGGERRRHRLARSPGSTHCSNGSTRARWSPSTGRWPSRWSRGRPPAWRWSTPSRPTAA